MICQPKYAETIIVLVKYKKVYRWFVTDNELWFLDLKKVIASYLEKGYEIHNPDDFSDRYDIAVVNEDTAEEFLEKIRAFACSHEALTEMLTTKSYNHISDMYPSLYVDFDAKKLISYYPEPASYEHYVPEGWTGKYEEFLDDVPQALQYWNVDEQNFFEECKDE